MTRKSGIRRRAGKGEEEDDLVMIGCPGKIIAEGPSKVCWYNVEY